jgi:hypothetical protein
VPAKFAGIFLCRARPFCNGLQGTRTFAGHAARGYRLGALLLSAQDPLLSGEGRPRHFFSWSLTDKAQGQNGRLLMRIADA